MKNPLTILVVESRDSHFALFGGTLDGIRKKLPIKVNVLRAVDMKSVPSQLQFVDAVITEVFLPDEVGGQLEALLYR